METFVNDTIKLIIYTNIDVSGYATLTIKFRRPDGTVDCWTAALCIGDNNCITYTTINGDLNIPGKWLIQAIAEDVGVALHGMWTGFTVHSPLMATCPPLTTLVPTTAP